MTLEFRKIVNDYAALHRELIKCDVQRHLLGIKKVSHKPYLIFDDLSKSAMKNESFQFPVTSLTIPRGGGGNLKKNWLDCLFKNTNFLLGTFFRRCIFLEILVALPVLQGKNIKTDCRSVKNKKSFLRKPHLIFDNISESSIKMDISI